jgi:hypothetical protein
MYPEKMRRNRRRRRKPEPEPGDVHDKDEQIALLFKENARLQALLKRREASVTQKLAGAQSIAKAITDEQQRTNSKVGVLKERLRVANQTNGNLRQTIGEKVRANAAAYEAALALKTAYFQKHAELREAEFRVALTQCQKRVETEEARVRLKEQECVYIDKYNLLRMSGDEKQDQQKEIYSFQTYTKELDTLETKHKEEFNERALILNDMQRLTILEDQAALEGDMLGDLSASHKAELDVTHAKNAALKNDMEKAIRRLFKEEIEGLETKLSKSEQAYTEKLEEKVELLSRINLLGEERRATAAEHVKELGTKDAERRQLEEAHEKELAALAAQHQLALQQKDEELLAAEEAHMVQLDILAREHEKNNRLEQAAAAEEAAREEERHQGELRVMDGRLDLKEVEKGELVEELCMQREEHFLTRIKFYEYEQELQRLEEAKAKAANDDQMLFNQIHTVSLLQAVHD